MRIRSPGSRRRARHGAARRPGRRPRGVVGGGLLRRGGRGGQGDHRRLRAGDRQAGRARLLSSRRSCRTRSWRRSRPASRPTSSSARYRHDYVGQWAFDGRLVDLTDAIGHFSDLFDPDALDAGHVAQRDDRPAWPLRAADGPRRPTTSTSGRACSSAPASRSRTSRRSGRRSGPSGATRSSRPCARPLGRDDIWGVGLPMSAGRSTPRTSSASSWLPTRPTT